MTKVALIYDFDGTLSPGNMQEYDFIPQLGKTPDEFWASAAKLAKDQIGDPILAYMYDMLKEASYKGIPIKKSAFSDYGSKVKFFEGVETWFDRINAYGKELSLEVEHYIISSGLREMIEGSAIASHFTKIYASAYMYDANGVAFWPALAVNYTAKTQYLFRINKGTLDESDFIQINKTMQKEDRPIPFTRMIYFGDGLTDVPCMRLVQENGGYSVAVFPPEGPAMEKGIQRAQNLKEEGRAVYIAPADYREDSFTDELVKTILNKFAAEMACAEYRQLSPTYIE